MTIPKDRLTPAWMAAEAANVAMEYAGIIEETMENMVAAAAKSTAEAYRLADSAKAEAERTLHNADNCAAYEALVGLAAARAESASIEAVAAASAAWDAVRDERLVRTGETETRITQ